MAKMAKVLSAEGAHVKAPSSKQLSANTVGASTLTRDQTLILLNQIALPPHQLFPCLGFYNHMVAKFGVIRPVVTIRPPDSSGSSAPDLAYDLTELLLSIITLMAHSEKKKSTNQVRVGAVSSQQLAWRVGTQVHASYALCGGRTMLPCPSLNCAHALCAA